MTRRNLWSVELEWDGVTRTVDGAQVTIDETADLFEPRPKYEPRRFAFDVPWPEAPAWIHEGRPAERAIARVYFDGELVGEHPVQSVTTRRGSRVASVVAADVPVRGAATIPPTYDATVRRVDQQATTDESTRQSNAWAEYLNNAKNAAERKARQEKVSAEQAVFDPTVYNRTREGLVFPVVIGQPGRGYDGTIDTCMPAIPCVMWDAGARLLAIAGHYLQGDRIVIWTTSDLGTSAGVYENLYTTRDAGGRLVTLVQVIEANYVETFGVGGTWYPPHSDAVTDGDDAIVIPAVWSPERTFYAACVGDTRGLSSDPCDVMQWLIASTQGVRADAASFEAVRHRLRGWELDTVIAAQTSGWDALEQDVVPVLPVRLVPRRRGVGVTYIDLDPHPSTIGRRLVVGRTLFPDPSDELVVERADGRRPTKWTLRYRWNPESSRYARFAVAGPENHRIGQEGVRRHGYVEDSIDAPWIHQHAVASRAAGMLLQRTALYRPTRRYLADPLVHGEEGSDPIRFGDTFFLDDNGLGVSRRRAIVSGIRRVGVALAIEVSLLS